MTTFFETEVECAICGHTCEVAGIGSTNQLGPSDLDFRPAEMARSTMSWWVQECPSCGYCAHDLEEAGDLEKVIVRSDAYRGLRGCSSDFPNLALRFHLAAFIAAEAGSPVLAFHHTLSEVWAHDDQRDTVRARAARLNAIDLLNEAHREGLGLMDEPGADAALAADLLRRAGKFDRSIEVCTSGRSDDCTDDMRKILGFQAHLCSLRNVDRHTMQEVMEGFDPHK